MATGDTKQTIFTEFWMVAGKPATEDKAGYEALTTWLKVAKPISLPERGDSSEDVSETALDTGRTEHFNGTVDGGSLDVPFITVEGDARQAVILGAAASNTTYSFVEKDPDGATVTAYYGRVGIARIREASANGFAGFTLPIRVNSARVSFAPTSGQFGTS